MFNSVSDELSNLNLDEGIYELPTLKLTKARIYYPIFSYKK